jgi:hypothetical protein
MENISSIDNRGTIQDTLRWFVPDTSFKRLNVENVKKYAKVANKSISSLAKDFQLSRPKFYQEQALISDRDIRLRLIPLVIISDLAFQVFGKDKEKTVRWVMEANHLFFGYSPFEMALGGKSESVIQILKEWLGQ